MDIRITGAPTGGSVKAIPSKSAAHRLMIAAALSGQAIEDCCQGLSKDITATKECMQRMQKSVKPSDAPARAGGDRSGGEHREEALPGAAEPAVFSCGESGSTLRFLIPIAAVLGIPGDFHCEGRLPDRPMQPFLEVLEGQGCLVTGRNPKQVRGRLRGGDFRLPGDISSQYVTGLLMALPLAAEESRITVKGRLQSRPYIDMTLEVLDKARIRVEEIRSDDGESTRFLVPGGQTYQLPAGALDHIEGDWSNAAFWITMDRMLRRSAAGEGRRPSDLEEVIRCEGLDPESRQGDRAVLTALDRMDAADLSRDDTCLAGPGGVVELDVSDIPDLVPILSAYACGRPRGTVTHITGAARLRFKESDRLQAVTEVLSALGGRVTEERDGLVIYGSGSLQGGRAFAHADHRIAMMAAAAACIAREAVLICGAEAVEKSYPAFFEDYRMLGGRAQAL